jgi:hypothetical protein
MGEERAHELVSKAMHTLRLHHHDLSAYEARAILEHISHEGGVVGASARIAIARLPTISNDPPNAQKQRTMRIADLAGLLAPSIGQERANELVEGACRKHAIVGEEVTREQMETILDDLATTPGVVGAVSRFAKARALLDFE